MMPTTLPVGMTSLVSSCAALVSSVLSSDLDLSGTRKATVKIPKIRTHEKFAVLTLKFEQDGFAEE